MRKRKVQWLAAACVFCLAQPVWAATESTTVYQDQLDSVGQSYAGEISKASTPEHSNIRVVRRGEKAKTAEPTEQLPTRIDADKMSYSGSTGNVYAQGDVVVTQGNQTLLAPRIEGNTKTTEYIESAITLDSTSIKTKFDKIAPILQTIHASGKELRGEFAPFEEIKKYESLIEEKIPYANYEAVRKEVFSLEKRLADLGVDRKSCHIDLVPENFIESPQGRLYLIDWEYSSMNDPMWDLAALFLESEFTRQEEETFLSHYESEQTPVSREKIAIYKILQDAIWSLWTVYKEEQGADFGDYGVSRYQRAVKGLAYYGGSDEK